MNYPTLRELRSRRGMSQVQLAFKAGIAQSVVSEVEAGRAMTAPMAQKLGAALDVPPASLVKAQIQEIVAQATKGQGVATKAATSATTGATDVSAYIRALERLLTLAEDPTVGGALRRRIAALGQQLLAIATAEAGVPGGSGPDTLGAHEELNPNLEDATAAALSRNGGAAARAMKQSRGKPPIGSKDSGRDGLGRAQPAIKARDGDAVVTRDGLAFKRDSLGRSRLASKSPTESGEYQDAAGRTWKRDHSGRAVRVS